MFEDNVELFGLLQFAIHEGSRAVRVANGDDSVDLSDYYEGEIPTEAEPDHDDYEFELFLDRHQKSRQRHYMRKPAPIMSIAEPLDLIRDSFQARISRVRRNLKRNHRRLHDDLVAAVERCFNPSQPCDTQRSESQRFAYLVDYLQGLSDEHRLAARLRRLAETGTPLGVNDADLPRIAD